MGNRQSIVPDSGQIAAHLIRLLGLNEVMNDMNQMFNKADIIFDRTQRAIAYFEVLTLVMIGYVTFLFILRVREKREGSVHGGLHLTLSPSSNTSSTIDTSSGASQMKLTFHTEAATTKQEDTLTKMIPLGVSQFDERLKAKARMLVKIHYKFESSNNLQANRKHQESLMEKSAYLYSDPVARTGLYKHKIIDELVSFWLSAGHSDEDIKYITSSKSGIRLAVTALVLTVVENCLAEWTTGEHIPIPFDMSMVTYQKNFDEHLMMLEKFHERTGMFNIDLQPGKHASQNILSVELVSSCTSQPQGPLLTPEDLDIASKDWEDNRGNGR